MKAAGSAELPSTKAPPYLRLIAAVSLLAGLAVGIWALAGPATVWLGLGDFRQGFGLLRQANAWSGWVALAAWAASVVMLLAGLGGRHGGAPRLAALAGVGAVAASLVWYVPQTFAPAEGTPVIHVEERDVRGERTLQFEAVVPLRRDAPNNLDYGVMPGVDSVQAHIDLQLNAYPDIKPQLYEDSVDEVFERALAAVDTLGWELVEADPGRGRTSPDW